MKKYFSGYYLAKLVCLLFMAGILCLSQKTTAYATNDTPYRESNLTGTNEERTNIEEPGASDNADDLSELNIANTVTVTYNNGNGSVNGALRILVILTLIAIAPSLIIMLTSFTRIIIVLHFTRQALNTQTAPPNIVLIGLALFLTFFIMQPTLATIYTEAVVPYEAGELEQEEALTKAVQPIREYMYRQTQKKDVSLFMEINRTEWDGSLDAIPMSVLVPSFIISELRMAFIIGFLIYIPFIVIDMVVASTLMSMGMMMLPPTTISMPFKILLFVLADGWYLVIKELVESFYIY
ncbi:MAG: flagellar type III secretion system pore protein FliP [Lachnospiraceae bacterium]|nr:flagellar type III secretion system pore protein FliP [Lachnospiraceae bacterium]